MQQARKEDFILAAAAVVQNLLQDSANDMRDAAKASAEDLSYLGIVGGLMHVKQNLEAALAQIAAVEAVNRIPGRP